MINFARLAVCAAFALGLAGAVNAQRTGVQQPSGERAAPKAAQDLKDSVKTGVTAAEINMSPPVPEFGTTEARLGYLRWLKAASDRLAPWMPDPKSRTEFLQTVWYECARSGLSRSLVLALIEQSSGFRAFAANGFGSRGYMAVATHWVNQIGDGDPAKLFHQQTNLRYGTVILRHYLDESRGDQSAALGRYLNDSQGLANQGARIGAAVQATFAAQGRWDFPAQ